MNQVTQHPIPPSLDWRDMLRQHLVRRSLACMDAAASRRARALAAGDIAAYADTVRRALRGFYDEFPHDRVIETPRAGSRSHRCD